MDIFAAIGSGDLERVRAVVEQDAAVMHATDGNGWTPLECSVEGGHVEVARYLLDQGATIDHGDDLGRTALHWACLWNIIEAVPVLLERGADATAIDEGGETPLMFAAFKGRDAVVRALLEHGGSNVDAANLVGRTACHHACHRNCPRVLRQLLEAGADPTVRDTDGRTSLDHAAGKGHQHCIRALMKWRSAYAVYRARSVRDASLVVANSSTPVDAVPTYLVDRTTSGLAMPVVHVSSNRQHGHLCDDVGEERHVEVDPVVVGGLVTVYAIEELTGEVFVELMELVGTTCCGGQSCSSYEEHEAVADHEVDRSMRIRLREALCVTM